MKRFFSLAQNGSEANIYIFGDITSWEWMESDVSSYTLSKTLEGIEADIINVYINSYGGEVAEGLAIYNMLKRHNAHVKTFVDGFACSIASVIFMAGDERIVSPASLLMVHNAWTYAAGNSEALRKQAEDLDKISQASINAYMSVVEISEDEMRQMLDAETWITPQEAFDKNFATAIIEPDSSNRIAQSTRQALFGRIISAPDFENAELAGMISNAIDKIAEIKQLLPERVPVPNPKQEQAEGQLKKFINAFTGKEE